MSESSIATPAVASDHIARFRLLRVIGVLGIVGGILMIGGGAVAWAAVSTELRAEKIMVSDDAAFLAGSTVADPFTAYAEAEVISVHAMKASNGRTYAELGKDDPVRTTMMTASFLRTSLFTSIVSFGVAAFAAGVGALFILFGAAVVALVPSTRRSSRV